eukprot:8910949-Pyramimonas_sp.AAC.1
MNCEHLSVEAVAHLCTQECTASPLPPSLFDGCLPLEGSGVVAWGDSGPRGRDVGEGGHAPHAPEPAPDGAGSSPAWGRWPWGSDSVHTARLLP